MLWALALAGCAFLALAVDGWFLLLLLPILVFILFYWIHIGEFFVYGDANPGIVVQINPTLVAVATDLTKGIGAYPAIKVFRTRLRRIIGQPPQLGTLLPTVASYSRSLDATCPHWANFDPRPLECATANPDTLEGVMASFAGEEYHRLQAAVQSLPSVTPGLYRLSEHGWEKVREFSVIATLCSALVAGFRPWANDLPRDLRQLASKRRL